MVIVFEKQNHVFLTHRVLYHEILEAAKVVLPTYLLINP